MARFTLQPGGVDYGKEGKREGQRHIYTFFGRSPGRPLQEITSVVRRFIGRPTHSFSAGSVARKNSSNDGCGRGGGEQLACCMRRRFACQCLSIQTYSRPHCPSGIFGLPELHYYSFWHQIPSFFLPPSPADRRTDGQPVWHLAVTSPRRRGATTSSPLANVQMTRDESVRDPRPKDGASHECACSWLPSPLHAVCWRPRLRMTQVLSAMPTRFHSHSKFPARRSVGAEAASFLPRLHSASAPIRV